MSAEPEPSPEPVHLCERVFCIHCGIWTQHCGYASHEPDTRLVTQCCRCEDRYPHRIPPGMFSK